MQRRTVTVQTTIAATLMALMILLSGPCVLADAAERGGADPFEAGSMRFLLFIGGGTAFGEHYTIIGVGSGR